MQYLLVYYQNLFFFAKLAISLLLAKFACLSHAVEFSDVNWLNSCLVRYL